MSLGIWVWGSKAFVSRSFFFLLGKFGGFVHRLSLKGVCMLVYYQANLQGFSEALFWLSSCSFSLLLVLAVRLLPVCWGLWWVKKWMLFCFCGFVASFQKLVVFFSKPCYSNGIGYFSSDVWAMFGLSGFSSLGWWGGELSAFFSDGFFV